MSGSELLELCRTDSGPMRYRYEIAAGKLLGDLPSLQRKVLRMHYIGGVSLRQVAQELSYSYSYIRCVKYHGLAALQGMPRGRVDEALRQAGALGLG